MPEGTNRSKLERLVGSSVDMWFPGNSAAVHVIIGKRGSGFVARDEGDAEYPFEAEDVKTICGRTILCE